MGAYCTEHAVDHLNRLLGKSRLDRLVQKDRMSENSHCAGADEPEYSGEWRGDQEERDGDEEQPGIELTSRCSPVSNLEVLSAQSPDAVHSSDDEKDEEKQPPVCQQAVDAEHGKDSGIVGREVPKVVVDSALRFSNICRFRDSLEVEEFVEGAKVSEPRPYGLRAQVVKSSREIKARSQNFDGNAYS